ncbi:phosphoribosylamine--glycine ligase [Lichenibacterium ramalinae]|uniref:Phosphoribosylamine--glycine ligase n=1 Tax=Lichenibacterium ramalinae TaxID=2316527 RepID=A0A4Q2RBX7_9HYPH|nr:phosphoribosylamine--glycine ligase [Lichenibacterium ramalinae]RYB02474.1 phosphoribosylamine--glycine ligase [Lichenibacterium ramalinae]
MDVLILGAGGREHALAAALAGSPRLGRLLVAPGNPGTAAIATNLALDPTDPAAVVALARREAVGLVVVGPEAPLVAGVADALEAAGIPVFGPSRAAARLEGSKGFTKDLARDFAIPTAGYGRFDSREAAEAHLAAIPYPTVIKADGLAAGKGVVIAADRAEAARTLEFMFGGGFGVAGASVVIEEFLEGEELSFFALCDGTRALPFASAQDHKRVGDGDTGPNTGGMGAISPAPVLDAALEARIMAEIVVPTLRGLAERGTPFKGVLFAGLMLTAAGPKLIEYNVRFGDPETQAFLPRLDQDLLPLLDAVARGALPEGPVRFRPEVGVSVVVAARGYPDAPLKGTEIRGLDAAAAAEGVTLFHAGTRAEDGRILADGGRVLTLTGLGPDAGAARARAYAAVDRLDWPEGFCRRDIGLRGGAAGSSTGGGRSGA